MCSAIHFQCTCIPKVHLDHMFLNKRKKLNVSANFSNWISRWLNRRTCREGYQNVRKLILFQSLDRKNLNNTVYIKVMKKIFRANNNSTVKKSLSGRKGRIICLWIFLAYIHFRCTLSSKGYRFIQVWFCKSLFIFERNSMSKKLENRFFTKCIRLTSIYCKAILGIFLNSLLPLQLFKDK